jgi:hypothetical protein
MGLRCYQGALHSHIMHAPSCRRMHVQAVIYQPQLPAPPPRHPAVTCTPPVTLQVVDARDPLLYRSDDLEAYARELCPTKTSFLLLNKADLLPRHIRKMWADHFDASGVGYAFFSAQLVSDAQQKARSDASTLGLDQEVRAWRGVRLQRGAAAGRSCRCACGAMAVGASQACAWMWRHRCLVCAACCRCCRVQGVGAGCRVPVQGAGCSAGCSVTACQGLICAGQTAHMPPLLAPRHLTAPCASRPAAGAQQDEGAGARTGAC